MQNTHTSLGGEDQAVVDLAVELVGGVASPELVVPVADGVLLPRLSALLVVAVAEPEEEVSHILLRMQHVSLRNELALEVCSPRRGGRR